MKPFVSINEDTRMYKGYKLAVNNTVRTIRYSKKVRLIEYNYRFLFRIKETQRIFMLEWCIRRGKCKDDYECDKKTLNYCKNHLKINEEDIYELFKTIQFNSKHNRQQRLYYLVTISENEHKILLMKQNFKKFGLWILKILHLQPKR